MEPLRGGRLVQGLPESAKRVFEKTTPKRSPAEWGLRWVWNHPEVTVILSGMNEIEQVEENVRIASEAKADSLTKEELEVFEQVKQEINKKIKVLEIKKNTQIANNSRRHHYPAPVRPWRKFTWYMRSFWLST